MKRGALWLIVLLGVGPAGCTTEESPGSGGDPPDPGAELAGVGPGEARAARLAAVDQLPSPGGDFAGAQAGDLALVNDRVIAVVRGVEAGWTVPGFHGGGLVDLYARGGIDTLREQIVIVGFREVKPTSFEVISDGADGGDAVVRVTGVDTDIHIIPEDFPISSGEPMGAIITTDYRLGPDDDFITLTTTIERAGAPLESFNAGDALYISDDGVPFLPGAERDADGPPVGQAPYVVQGGLAAVADPPNPGSLALSIDNITGLLPANVEVAGGRPGSFVRRFYVGDPEAAPAHLAGRVEEFMGTDMGRLAVEGVPRDAVIEVRGAGGKLVALGDGGEPFPAPAGDLAATPVLDGRKGAEVPVTVAAGGEATVVLSAPGFATLTLSASDEDGGPLPARAQIIPAGGGGQVALLPPGGVDVRVPTGELRVVVSRGFEYELHDETVTVEEGGAASVSAVLHRVVDTPGAVSADTHIHSIWSTDSKVTEARRVLSIAAEGVEIPVATDHDMVTLYRVPPELTAWVNPIIGSEVSTSDYGHFNGYPLPRDPTAPRNGSPDWLGMEPSDVFDSIRGVAGGETVVVQVNHPMRGSSAYFDVLGFTGAGGAAPPDGMALGFDCVEVYNRGEDDAIDDVLIASAALLDTGKRLCFVGVSDSHTIDRWVGNPRTHVRVGTDDPSAVTPEAFADALLAGKNSITAGPYLEASVEGDGPYQVTVKVQAPSWVPVDKITVVTPDGVVGERTDLATQDSVVRFDDVIEVDAPSGQGPAWLYVRVDGPRGGMSPAMSGPVFAVTSPFYL